MVIIAPIIRQAGMLHLCGGQSRRQNSRVMIRHHFGTERVFAFSLKGT